MKVRKNEGGIGNYKSFLKISSTSQMTNAILRKSPILKNKKTLFFE